MPSLPQHCDSYDFKWQLTHIPLPRAASTTVGSSQLMGPEVESSIAPGPRLPCTHTQTARQQGGSVDGVPGLRLHPLQLAGLLQEKSLFSLRKQMVAIAYSALRPTTCQAPSMCSLLWTSFAISGNRPVCTEALPPDAGSRAGW